jgi:hypothetical protein
MGRHLLFISFILTALTASAQQYILSGRVSGQKNEPISFTSIYIRNSTYGTTANEEGKYLFKLSPGTYNIVYRFVGYREKMIPVTITDHNDTLNVQLDDEIFKLTDTAKYNSKTDRGMAIMRNVLANRKKHMDEFKTYSCAVYIKGVQKLTKAPKSLMGSAVTRQLDLDSNGRGILYQAESC